MSMSAEKHSWLDGAWSDHGHGCPCPAAAADAGRSMQRVLSKKVSLITKQPSSGGMAAVAVDVGMQVATVFNSGW